MLDQQGFRSISVEGYELLPDSHLDLAFNGAGLSTTLGCTVKSAPFIIEDGRLTWMMEPIQTSARETCSRLAQLQDEWWTSAMGRGFDVRKDGEGNLVLTSDTIEIVLEPRPVDAAPPGLYGSIWYLETVVVVGDDAFGPAPTVSTPTLRFEGADSVQVSTGCNQGSMLIRLNLDASASAGFADFDGLSLTAKPCGGAAGEVEERLASVFDGATVIRFGGGRLTVGSDDVSLIYRSKD